MMKQTNLLLLPLECYTARLYQVSVAHEKKRANHIGLRVSVLTHLLLKTSGLCQRVYLQEVAA